MSEHFVLAEFERSATAVANHINNRVLSQYVPALEQLCKTILEPLREFAQQPIIIGSGYRCPQLNAAVGGSKTSQHMKGEACDIHLSDMKKLRQWFTYLMDGQFDQLIMERASKTSTHYWIHVSCRKNKGKNRHQVLRLTKK